MPTTKWSRLLSLLLCLALAAGMLPAALAEEPAPPVPSVGETVPVTAVTLDQSQLTLTASETATLTATVEPSDASDPSVSWSSEDSSIASVSGGVVTAVAPGSTIITASAGSAQATCRVTVSQPQPAAVTGVELSRTELNFTKAGDSTVLQAIVQPLDAGNQSVSWQIGDPSVATVDQQGRVTAASNGTTIVTVTTQEGSFTAKCTVRVQIPTSTTVSLDKSSLSLMKGRSETLVATVIPDTAEDRAVTWRSSDPAVASVDQRGRVTAVAPGTAAIVAALANGQEDACAVTVRDTVSLSPTNLALVIDQSGSLTLQNLPSNASVGWSGGNSSVAILTSDNSGCTLKGLAAGTATITATVTEQDGTVTSLTSAITVSVAAKPTLTNSSLSVAVKKTASLSVNNLPTGGSVTWSTSSSSVASISSSGTGKVNATVTGAGRGSAKITVVVKNSSGATVATLECAVTVTNGTASDVTYTVSSGEAVSFSASDFNSVASSVTGYTLSYVTFSLPSSSRGILYYDYNASNGEYDRKVSSSTKYYRSSGTYLLGMVSFVAQSDYSGSVSFSYTGVDVNGNSYTGTVSITVKDPSGIISYTTDLNQEILFDESDFNSACKKLTGYTLSYVKFTLPSSTRGTLYYQYGESGEKKVSSSTSYYYDESSYLRYVSFVPAKGWSGTLSISFTGRSTRNTSFSGTVEITVNKTADDIIYTVEKNESLLFDDADFNSYCKDLTGSALNYVRFTLPSSSRGALYYKYEQSGQKAVTASTSYYRSNSSPYLEDVSFVPARNYTGTVSISFTGKSTGGESITGTVKIYVGTSASGDISYSANVGESVSLLASDFNSYCKNETGGTLDFVSFTLPSTSKGVLYYKYGASSQKKVSSTLSYYRSESPYLEDVSFVPVKGLTGSVSIPFSGESTGGKSFSGTLMIQYSNRKDPSTIVYTTGGSPVPFRSSDFAAACNARGGNALSSVKFTLPDPNMGRLYFNYISPSSHSGLVSSSTSYTTSGSNAIDYIAFVPKAGYSGKMAVAYTGTDRGGSTYTGYVQITVAPASSSARFKDMGSYSWASPSVDFLYDYKITTGTTSTTYGPSGAIVRGDFILMLSRAFRFTSAGSNSFTDVPSSSYYAQAIASAKAMGIAQGGSDGKFNPTAPLTREDAMVLLQRTLDKTGHSIASASNSYLSRFPDGAKVSSYAQSAVAALIQAGVVKGDDAGRINPKGSLSRAEMAVILHRVLTL